MNRGITLLISILILTSAMSIALGISYIVLSEFNINRTAKESYSAFFAADFGKECALFYHSGNGDPVELPGGTYRFKSFWDPDNPCYENDGFNCAAADALKCGGTGGNFPVTHTSVPAGCDRSDLGCIHTFTAEVNYSGLNLCTDLRVVSTVYAGGSVTTLIESRGISDCTNVTNVVNRSIEVCVAPTGLSC